MVLPGTRFILVVEDDNDLRNTLIEHLMLIKNTIIIEARDGVEAVQKCRLQVFNCIICDINMPKMPGNVVIETIRNDRMNAETPIIVLSGFLDKRLVMSIRDKIQKAFTKPTNLVELNDYVKETLDKNK